MMKKDLRLFGVSVVVLASVLLGSETPPVFAVYFSDTGASQTQTSVGATVNNSDDTETSVGVDASISGESSSRSQNDSGKSGDDTNASVKTGAAIQVEKDSSGPASDSAKSEDRVRISAPVGVSASTTGEDDWRDGAIIIGRGDVNEKDSESADATSTSSSTLSPIAVHTAADFKVFAAALVKDDNNIHEVKVGKDGSEVDYSYSGKLFGFITVHPVAKASVDADGKVTVTKPWYSFFVKDTTSVAADPASFQSDVSAKANASVGTSANAMAKEAAWLKAVAAVLKANVDSSVNASASTAANASVSY